VLRDFAERTGHPLLELDSPAAVQTAISRAYPAAVVIDGSPDSVVVSRAIKGEPFTAVVPVIFYLDDHDGLSAEEALEAGADEVLMHTLSERERDLRFALSLRRAERDVSVHPTTFLPGTVQIERDFAERLRAGLPFAVCYADLDHFKEFNDRYGYHHGDRVILILSRILRDVVRAHAPEGFVGHIGGDDFIFNVPLAQMRRCCEDALEIFDELIPLQYPLEDRERGYFLGHDRRGEAYRVPLMTLSIGVVTNEHRRFTHTAQISELATEMKTYAKTLPGSVYAVDRRVRDTPRGSH
jgi:diguanylate cyclase (GGDEF)-like protein